MNHLTAGWRLATSPRSNARLQHVWLPEDPGDAHRLLVGLAGRTARRVGPSMPQLRSSTQRRASEGVQPYDHARLADIGANEGFSHHPSHGAAPDSGWMVSYHAPEGSGIGQVHKIHDLALEHIADHRSRIQSHLHEPSTYQGGWHDTSTGDVYLDVSKHFPEHHEPEAKDFAVHQRQKAIFHLGDFTERFMDPHQDPLRSKDEGEWHARYGGDTRPHPGWSSYSHMYPDTPDQAHDRGMSKGSMRGRVAHPGQRWNP